VTRFIGILMGMAAACTAALVGGSQPPSAHAAEVPPAVVRNDLPYYAAADADPKRHRLDLYLPPDKKSFPLIVFIHGGAWKSGTKELYGPLARSFVRHGIGVAVANYRLSPAVEHPEHVKDVAKAFAWVTKNAKEQGADPTRIYAMGHSAGAHLVALLALDPKYLKAEGLTSSAIRGVVGVSGPYALGPTGFENVFGADAARRLDSFPLSHVADLEARHIPPFLILAADKDYPGLPQIARTLADALGKHGAKAHSEELPNRDHITIITGMAKDDDPAVKQIVKFIAP